MQKGIVHINPQLEIIGWMERYIEQFYVSFSKRYSVSILTFWSKQCILDIPQEILYTLKEDIHTGILYRIYCLIVRSNHISKFCKKNNIGTSISHWEIANIFNIFSKFFGNKAMVVVVVHNTFDIKSLWFLLYYLCIWLYRFADKVVCVSHELANDIKIRISSNHVVTILNSFDIDLINSLKNDPIDTDMGAMLSNWKINICNVGRFDDNKNQALLLDYFYLFYQKNKNVQLFFIGDWDMQYISNIKQKITEYNIYDSVFLLGYQKNIYKYLDKMDYACYTNTHEWFGRSLVDALIVGIPVLTHDYKYWAKEIIRNQSKFDICEHIEIHENGILTKFLNREQYIAAMDLLPSISFDKKIMMNNTHIYNSDFFAKAWSLLLK